MRDYPPGGLAREFSDRLDHLIRLAEDARLTASAETELQKSKAAWFSPSGSATPPVEFWRATTLPSTPCECVPRPSTHITNTTRSAKKLEFHRDDVRPVFTRIKVIAWDGLPSSLLPQYVADVADAERVTLRQLRVHDADDYSAVDLLDDLQSKYEPHFRDPPDGQGEGRAAAPPDGPGPSHDDAPAGESTRPGRGDIGQPAAGRGGGKGVGVRSGLTGNSSTLQRPGRTARATKAAAGDPVALRVLSIYKRIARTPRGPVAALKSLVADKQFVETVAEADMTLDLLLVRRAKAYATWESPAQKSPSLRKSVAGFL